MVMPKAKLIAAGCPQPGSRYAPSSPDRARAINRKCLRLAHGKPAADDPQVIESLRRQIEHEHVLGRKHLAVEQAALSVDHDALNIDMRFRAIDNFYLSGIRID